jgi:sulfhydrogenase subunit gamma (sulfur reductase)
MEGSVRRMSVESTRDETEQTRLLTLKREADWVFTPGQVALLGVEGVGEATFAIASAPEDIGILDFLVKDAPGVAASIYGLEEGDTLQVTGPLGTGFPIDQYEGRDLLIEAVGSAIAPMRGVIRSVIYRRSNFGKVKAVFGARYPADFPFSDEMDGWREAGIDVILTVSRPEGTDWSGRSGYVTAHCQEVIEELDRPVALVCGMEDMMQDSREELGRLGIDEGEVLTNV